MILRRLRPPSSGAVACGTRALISNVFFIQEAVGNATIQVNPFAVDEIADAIQKVIQNSTLREPLRQVGLPRAKQFHVARNRGASETLERAADDISSAINVLAFNFRRNPRAGTNPDPHSSVAVTN